MAFVFLIGTAVALALCGNRKKVLTEDIVQIKQTGQPIPVSKVETDRREEVKNIKPIGSQQIPDSFETGKAGSVENQSSTSSAEPEKKAGQITGGILIKQMTQARLADAGIKVSSQSKETKGKKDLNETQQDQAEATAPEFDLERRDLEVDTQQGARIPDGAYTGDARSNVEKNKQALRDFMAEHNIEAGHGSGTGSTATGGGNIPASDFGIGGDITANDLNSGPAGPGNPFDGVSEKLGTLDYLKSQKDLGTIASQLQNAATDQGSGMGYGKDMIAEDKGGGAGYPGMVQFDDEGVKGGSGKAAKDNPGLNNAVNQTYINGGHGTEREWALMASKDGVNPNDYMTDDGYRVQTGKDGTKVITSPDGTKTVIKPDSSATSVSPDGSTRTTDSKGKTTDTTPPLEDPKKGKSQPGVSDTTDENYVDPGAEKLRQQMDQMSKNLGMDGLWNLRRGPKNQGKGPDYGPEPVGVSKEDASPSVISQFGEHGLIGQPNQDSEVHDGGNANFHGLPGDTVTDPQEGDPYHGSRRNDEVNTSLQTGMEENVDHDDEKKSKRKIDFKAPADLQRFSKFDNK